MLDMNSIVGSHDIVFITLDTLRFDVAQRAFETGQIPNLSRWLPREGWQCRHSPGNFTYAAHHAFFAGFLPTPVAQGPHPRLFAAKFPGSETTIAETFEFEESNLVTALANRGYETLCIGGVGFFNRETALGSVLPDLFQRSYWSPAFGVTCPQSAENQVRLAVDLLSDIEPTRRLFLFINVSALHQPNYFYLPGAQADSAKSQLAALIYVDHCLSSLFNTLASRAPALCIVCSDHGTAYGESGYQGHRLNHPVVGNVPYIDFVLTNDPRNAR